MKKNSIIKIIYLVVIMFSTFCFLFSASALAQIKLETELPIIPNQPAPNEGLPQYINYFFVFGLGLITIVALTQMIIGGMMYILAAGNAAKVEDAKDTIFQALFGLGILLVSYLLLLTINPDLVKLKNPNLTPASFNSTLNSDPRFSDPESAEELSKCLYNKKSEECEKLEQNQCKVAVTDQFDPCYCVQNPTAAICSTNMF